MRLSACSKRRAANRGYTSQSELYTAGKRLKRYAQGRQKPVIIHLGDHDPSGIDMSRDIEDRVSLFAGHPVEVRRIALNMDQVQHYNPPPNPAKITDSRFAGYEAIHGDESWELDALAPQVIHQLIVETVAEYRDEDLWDQAVKLEAAQTKQLAEVSEKWEDVAAWLESQQEGGE